MTATSSSSKFTESLLKLIREQRHQALRVIIATQEPTISPALLDLSSLTIVHRFTSPSWLTVLKSHLAGMSVEGETSKRDIAGIFKLIVNLEAGQALLFSPSAMTGSEQIEDAEVGRGISQDWGSQKAHGRWWSKHYGYSCCDYLACSQMEDRRGVEGDTGLRYVGRGPCPGI